MFYYSKYLNKKNINTKYYQGFTLTEALITLAIIGIIATLTIPALIQSIQISQYQVSYKKAIRDANIAIKKAGAEELLNAMTAQNDVPAMNNNFNVFMDQFIVAKSCLSGDNSSCWDRAGEFVTSPANRPPINSDAFIDNSGFAWVRYSEPTAGEAMVMVDTNNFKSPNQYGKDRWILKFVDSTGSRSSGIPVSVLPYSDDRTTANSVCHYPPCYYTSWLTGTN